MADNIQENGEVPKTAKQLEKEAKKQAKLDKLKQKLEKQSSAPVKKDAEVSNLFQEFRIRITVLFYFAEKRKEKGSERICSV